MTSPDVYRHPRYYDVAFGWDPGPEADFLEACFQRYAPGEVVSVLDVACGAGRFSLEFARRGRTVAGLDISRDMIEYLGKKAALEGLPVEVFVRDMRDFQLPRRDFGAAICMTDSFTYLPGVAAITAHFRSVARHLTPGGVYVVDFGTVVDLERPFGEPERWEMSRDDVRVVFTGNVWEDFDPVQQVATEVLRMEVIEHSQPQVIEQRLAKRVLYPQEFLALVEASGVFELATWFQGFDLDRPFHVSPYHRRLMAILRKTAELPAPRVQAQPLADADGRRKGKPELRKVPPPAPPKLPPPRSDSNAIEEYWARGRDEPWRPPGRAEAPAQPATPAPGKRRRRRRKKSGSPREEKPGS